MFDLPTLLCCLNYANIYCLEISCLILSISIFSLNLFGILEIKWSFMKYFTQILYSINLAVITFTFFMIIFIILSTTSKRILINNYYKAFANISLMSSYIFLYLLLSFSICAYAILSDYIHIKSNKYDFKDFNKYEIIKIKDLVKNNNYWVLLYILNLVPILFSFINIFLWISIYYRISFRIYCSFNYEIRKELRKEKKREMTKLEEETVNDNDKNKGNKIEKVEVSVVFEKDRHPSYTKNIMTTKKYNDMKFNLKNIDKFKEEFPSGISSSNRDFDNNNNN